MRISKEADNFEKSEQMSPGEMVSRRIKELQNELRMVREMNDRLMESNKWLNSFLQISRKITTTLDQRELMQEIVDNATAAVNIESGALYMIKDQETISLAATVPALPEDFPERFRLARISDHPHIRHVLTAKSYLLVEDSKTAEWTPAELEIVQARNLCTLLYLPISLRESVTGVLILGSTGKRHMFTGEEIELLQGFANQAAQVSENVRNYEQTKEYATKMESEVNERIRAEEAMQQAGHILENMQIGLYVYQLENPDDDRTLRLKATNPASGKLSGVRPSELVGRYIDEIFPTLRDLGIPKRFADVVRTGIAGEFEDFYYSGDRLLQAAYAVKAFPLPNQQVGITFDNITRRKQAENEQRKSEERYRKLISTVPDLIVLTDIDGTITYINDIPFPALKHHPKETFLGQNVLSFIAEEDLPLAIENTRLMFDRKLGPKEYKLKTEDGAEIFSEVNGDVIYDADNMPSGMVYVIRDITERKQAEAALRIGEERFKSIIAISNTGAWEYHLDGNFLWCSREYFTMLGRHPEDYPMDGSANLTETWIDLLHPDDRERASRHFADYLAGGSVGMYENYFRLQHSNGGWVWIWSRGQTLRDSEGKLTNRTLGTHIDITGSKQAEEELINAKEKVEINERKLKDALEIGKMGSWELDTRSGVFTFTDNFYKIFHTSAEKMGGYQMTIADYARRFVHPDDAFQVAEENQKALESNDPGFSRSLEHRIVYDDGGIGYISVRFFIVKDEAGNTVKTYGVNQDITEKKLAEFELVMAKEKAEESEEKIRIQNQDILFTNERLESLLRISQYQTDSIQDLLDFALSEAVNLTRSKIGYIYYYSEENRQFILNTWSKEVMKECQVMNPQTVYDLDQTGCWGEAVRQRKPIIINDYQAENPLKRGTPDGHVKLEKFLTIPVIFDNKIVAVAGVANKPADYDSSDIRQLTLLMDNVWRISERLILIKDLQSAKEKAEESDRLKSAFLANMSHEIRTPMNGILGFAELLKEPGLSGDEQQQYIGIIERSGHRMLNIINDIVDISKIEAGLTELHLSESNINDQIVYIYTFFKPEAEAKGIDLSVRDLLPDHDAILTTDREKVYVILTNLVKNAIKYTQNGYVELGCVLRDSFVEFYVKDTGIGIPLHRQKAIFERFIQADIEDKMAYQGAGLGLSISKAYVEMLGGEIRVESEEDKGTAFFFNLPRHAAEASKM